MRYRPIVAAAMGLASYNAQASSISNLLASVPAPPSDVGTALQWVQNGQIVAPEYVKFKQALEAERAAITTLNGGPLPDPLAAASADIPDAPEVQTAIRGYDAYLEANSGKLEPKTALRKRTGWLQAAMGTQLLDVVGQMKPCPDPCRDAAVNTANAPLMFKKQLLGEADLKQWVALFADWRKTRAPLVSMGDQNISATADGAKAKTPAGKSAIAQYRAAMLKEVDALLSLTELAVKRSDAIASNKIDAVSSPSRSKPKT